jgi:hypothetical protein
MCIGSCASGRAQPFSDAFQPAKKPRLAASGAVDGIIKVTRHRTRRFVESEPIRAHERRRPKRHSLVSALETDARLKPIPKVEINSKVTQHCRRHRLQGEKPAWSPRYVVVGASCRPALNTPMAQRDFPIVEPPSRTTRGASRCHKINTSSFEIDMMRTCTNHSQQRELDDQMRGKLTDASPSC